MDADPLVVVSLSSQYMHQEEALGRVLAALDGLPLRVRATIGHELAPSEIAAPGTATVVDYVPHLAVVPRASLVLTHGGMGTIMAAFAFGIPLVCLPQGRDQEINSDRVEALGAGRRLAADAASSEIRAATLKVLGSEEFRRGARHMAEVVGRYPWGALAVEELEGTPTGPSQTEMMLTWTKR
jgi:UDP:flavonoid glycosyltransferase YjiC (YdhE family)